MMVIMNMMTKIMVMTIMYQVDGEVRLPLRLMMMMIMMVNFMVENNDTKYILICCSFFATINQKAHFKICCCV